jgi:transposase
METHERQLVLDQLISSEGRLLQLVNGLEAAWSYQYPARIAKEKAEILVRLPKHVRDIAWKAQTRLCARYRSMSAKGKKPTVVVTAIARELAGFIWAIGQEMRIEPS